jgi:anthranilate/para-aminobenzoate synthase component II
LNELEVVPTLLGSMAAVMQRIDATGGMATKEEVVGLSNVAQNVAGHIQILARDKSQKAIVKQFGDQLGKLNNLLKGYAQRLAEQQSKQNGNGLDPETAAKIQSIVLQAQTKAQNTKLSHAQRTAQRQVQFEAEQKRKDTETAAQIQRDNAKTAAEIVHNRMRSVEE